MRKIVLLFAFISSLAGCATHQPLASNTDAALEVMATERAFAQTMAGRNLAGFAEFVDEEAVFFAGAKALRGKQQVVTSWTAYFASPEAPFSWEPEQVEVLDSGNLALSTGPVRNTDGKIVARFNSIWRRDAHNRWRIIFDKGSEVCEQ